MQEERWFRHCTKEGCFLTKQSRNITSHYNVATANCECFAIFCKTNITHKLSGPVSAVGAAGVLAGATTEVAPAGFWGYLGFAVSTPVIARNAYSVLGGNWWHGCCDWYNITVGARRLYVELEMHRISRRLTKLGISNSCP